MRKITKTPEELAKLIDALEPVVERKRKKFDEKWFKQETTPDYWAYAEALEEALTPEGGSLREARGEYRATRTYELSELPDFGDVFPLSDFIRNVIVGGFIDSDGFGHYVKDGKESDVEIYPSDVERDLIREDFDTMVWYNK